MAAPPRYSQMRTNCRHSCARMCFTAIKCRLTTEYAAATLVSANDTGVAKNFFVGHRCPVRILSDSCSSKSETRINARKTSVRGIRHSSMATDKTANAMPQADRKAKRFCPMRHGGRPEKQYRTGLVAPRASDAAKAKEFAVSRHLTPPPSLWGRGLGGGGVFSRTYCHPLIPNPCFTCRIVQLNNRIRRPEPLGALAVCREKNSVGNCRQRQIAPAKGAGG